MIQPHNIQFTLNLVKATLVNITLTFKLSYENEYYYYSTEVNNGYAYTAHRLYINVDIPLISDVPQFAVYKILKLPVLALAIQKDKSTHVNAYT